MSTIEIQPAAGPLDAGIRPPGSKSLTNRALVCAALARGTSTLGGVLESEDTQVMIDAIRGLGIAIGIDHRAQVAEVTGCGGAIPASSGDLYVAASGTTVRFLTALVAIGHGTFRLHGTPRMHQRPIADLLDALVQLGVQAESEAGTGCPPVVVRAAGLKSGRVTIRGDVSSQFLSGLLMAAPCAAAESGGTGLEIEIDGPLVSKPYVEMTLSVMRAFGAQVDVDRGWRKLKVAPTGYVARAYEIEPDASAASYFWAAAAVSGGRVLVEGLGNDSLQGDVAFLKCLAQMGCNVREEASGTLVEGGPLVGIDVDMNAISDTVQTLAVVALFANGPTNLRNVAHIRHKETDRIAALATELRKLGATVQERHDGLRIVPAPLHGAQLDTYDDHRMAMSLALAGLKVPGVIIRDPQCTAKTYPAFWEDLQRLRG